MPDRTLLLLACGAALAAFARLQAPVQHMFALAYAVEALRSHRRARGRYVNPSATNNSSTARCASSIA
jgi:hypothetical protein